MLSHPTVGELRVTAYRALGLLSAGSRYAGPLRALGFGGDDEVLVAADEAGNGILGTITLEAFAPASELAKDDTEADIRALAVAPPRRDGASGANCWRPSSSVPNSAGYGNCDCARGRRWRPRSTSTRRLASPGPRNSTSPWPWGHSAGIRTRTAAYGADRAALTSYRRPVPTVSALPRRSSLACGPGPRLRFRGATGAAGPRPARSSPGRRRTGRPRHGYGR
jgi:hypothetical protein